MYICIKSIKKIAFMLMVVANLEISIDEFNVWQNREIWLFLKIWWPLICWGSAPGNLFRRPVLIHCRWSDRGVFYRPTCFTNLYRTTWTWNFVEAFRRVGTQCILGWNTQSVMFWRRLWRQCWPCTLWTSVPMRSVTLLRYCRKKRCMAIIISKFWMRI